MTRRAIGPDQIKDGNKIECHVSGSCAGYLDTDGNWQISDNTVRQHFDSPDDSTTGREIWTNRPLTVGVNTYGARDEMVTIRESSSLGKHTEWQITPIDDIDLRRRTQDLDTEYDLGDQVVQATSNNTTRIFTPYTGQERISYEIVAPAGGEIRNENGQFNAYRDDFYLFTIAEPTVYDADKQLITDAEGLPVRCYDLRVADMGRDEAGRRLYTVTKVRSADVPAGCVWVDVEITQSSAYYLERCGAKYESWSTTRSSASGNGSEKLPSAAGHCSVCNNYDNYRYYIRRTFLNYLTSSLPGAIAEVKLRLTGAYFNGIRESLAIQSGTWDFGATPNNNFGAIGTATYGADISIDDDVAYDIDLPVSCINNNGDYTSLVLREYDHDYLNVAPPQQDSQFVGTAFDGYNIGTGNLVLTVLIDPGHTGAFKPAEIVGSVPSEGGVVQVDFTGSDPVGLDIANNLSDTSGATDVHFRTVDGSGDPDELIPFQRLSASGSGSSFAYSAKLDMPAGVTDFCICYGPNNPPSSDYTDFSSTVSGTAINSGEEDPGAGFWGWPSGDVTGEIVKTVTSNIFGEIVKSVTSNIFGDIIKPIM